MNFIHKGTKGKWSHLKCKYQLLVEKKKKAVCVIPCQRCGKTQEKFYTPKRQ